MWSVGIVVDINGCFTNDEAVQFVLRQLVDLDRSDIEPPHQRRVEPGQPVGQFKVEGFTVWNKKQSDSYTTGNGITVLDTSSLLFFFHPPENMVEHGDDFVPPDFDADTKTARFNNLPTCSRK